MSYTIYVTETNVSAVVFDSKEEAEEWMNEPDVARIVTGKQIGRAHV